VPILVRHRYGFGQVFWLGIDSTWRWRHLAGNEYHHRFWGQLTRTASQSRAAGNELVRFGPDRSEVFVGDDAVLRARFSREFARRFETLSCRAEISRREGDSGAAPAGAEPFAVVDLKPVASQPLDREARGVSLPAGDYDLKLVVDKAGADLPAVTAELHVHVKPSRERIDLSTHSDLLAELATASGGRLLDPWEARRLPDLLRGSIAGSAEQREVPLWNHWLALTMVLSLLTAEWAVRKRNGLP
jgi:hypothetical protein